MRGEGLARWLEVPVAIGGLLVASPLLALSAVVVKVTSQGPVLYRQARVGRGGRPFTLIKLRTMRSGPAGTAVTARGDTRITSVGRWLRKAKIDELPELWHVVTGEMSLVGPRPEVPSLVDLSDPRWREVLSVRPGLTDAVTLALRNEEELLSAAKERLGEVEGFYRNHLQPWKLDRYIRYQRGRTARTDLNVLFETCLSVVQGSAANAPSIDEVMNAPRSNGSEGL